jgi:hypothetical protein
MQRTSRPKINPANPKDAAGLLQMIRILSGSSKDLASMADSLRAALNSVNDATETSDPASIKFRQLIGQMLTETQDTQRMNDTTLRHLLDVTTRPQVKSKKGQ